MRLAIVPRLAPPAIANHGGVVDRTFTWRKGRGGGGILVFMFIFYIVVSHQEQGNAV